MPTYEYRCPQGHEFEKFFRTISAAQPAVRCPECDEPAVRQMSAGAGLMFKGSGFYLTDYGKNAHSSKGSGSPGTKGEGAAAGESKSDGKPEKSESKSESKSDATADKGGVKPTAAAPKPKTE